MFRKVIHAIPLILKTITFKSIFIELYTTLFYTVPSSMYSTEKAKLS